MATDALLQAAETLFKMLPPGKEPVAEALACLPNPSFTQRHFLWKVLKKYEFSLRMIGLKVPAEPVSPPTLPNEPYFVDFINSKFILRLSDKQAAGIFTVPKAKYDRKTGLYSVPYRLYPTTQLHAFIKETGVFTTEAAKTAIVEMYYEMRARHKASIAHDAELDLHGFGLALDPYQVAGIKGAIRFRRGFVADAMGLGKTRQALGFIHLTQKLPALVICPPSVVANWGIEAEQGLVVNGKPFYIWTATSRSAPMKHTCTQRQLSLLDMSDFDRACNACLFQQAHLIIVNYHKLYAGWKCQFDENGKRIKGRKREKGERMEVQLSELGAAIKARGVRTVIVDESTYIKNEATQTFKSVMEIATGSECRLALTGTPIKNRVSELIAPLKFLDRLDDLGGEEVFYREFCDSNAGEKDGLDPNSRLNKLLRAIGYIQRNKRDVRKDLPPIRHSTLWLEIDNREEYERVERDLVNWCAEQAVLKAEFLKMLEDLPPHMQDAARERKMIETRLRIMRAQALIKVHALKRVTAKGKLEAIKQWVADFLATDNKLVGYGFHREIITQPLISEFKCLHIVGGDDIKNRQKHKEIFQGERGNFEGLNGQLIIISDAAREGVSLDAADDIALFELPWSPADEDQIIARVDRHRAHNITAWRLVAADTVEVKILQLLDNKRKICEAVTKGGGTPAEVSKLMQEGIIDDLFTEIAGMSTNTISPEVARERAKAALGVAGDRADAEEKQALEEYQALVEVAV